jgi:hypothetical protein
MVCDNCHLKILGVKVRFAVIAVIAVFYFLLVSAGIYSAIYLQSEDETETSIEAVNSYRYDSETTKMARKKEESKEDKITPSDFASLNCLRRSVFWCAFDVLTD